MGMAMQNAGKSSKLLAGLAAISALTAALPAAAEVRTLTYNVRHPVYGRIGTYTNVIDRSGSSATIKTDARIRVSIMGVVLYRQDISRTEHWLNGRLMSFEGLTTVNSEKLEVDGMADGDRFLVMSPSGTVSAPATVKLANPWSPEVLKGDAILTPDRGRLESVRIVPSEEGPIPVEGKTVRAKRYEVDRTDGTKRYEVWVDGSGTTVMFRVYNRNGVITFTLSS